MLRLAQVSDPHFQGLHHLTLRDCVGKRLLGAFNLLVRRRHKHSMALLRALAADLSQRSFDHLVLTGDLCNIAVRSEWSAALRWIEDLPLSADGVTVIPGNHDAYVADVVRQGVFEQMFAAYQTAELRVGGHHYPFVRLRGELALLCASSAVPTGDLGAWGRLGEAQLGRLEALLTAPEVVSRRRILLIHHPPLVNRPGEDRNLRDREQLQALLARTGADLVLHGHDHRDFFKQLAGPRGSSIPVVGVGSASYRGPVDRSARYHIFAIDAGSVEVTTYAHDPARGAFVEWGRRQLCG
ncbi:MAG: metallophosphoesterase [Polyangia bacterium]|jgi:3',5'-cyclic AMP phosphodiesterase CpdA